MSHPRPRPPLRLLVGVVLTVLAACSPPTSAMPGDDDKDDDSAPAAAAQGQPNVPGQPHSQTHRHTNRLATESSPYLLQHAHNPVDWYPWGDEAFAKAQAEDKPIFLSIGYSTCHWCHVMERESFESEAIAAVLNEHFISIKVDREERPDVDAIYMKAVMALTGHGGWPLSAWLGHDRKPFHGGTYFPPEDRHGRPGFKTILLKVAEVWKTDRAALADSAAALTKHVQGQNVALGGGSLDAATLETATKTYAEQFDALWGGFGRSPKFPSAFGLSFMLRQRGRGRDAELLKMAETTLEKMRLGGIHDHLGGGIHRYSTDREWLVPHFEKMLYDQAYASRAALDLWQVTGEQRYRDFATGIFDYVLRDLLDDSGAFHSAEDADSEGVEGKFYVWKRAELIELLGEKDGALFADVYRATESGNFLEESTRELTGDNILHLRDDLETIAEKRDQAEPFAPRIAALREKLLAVRSKRIRPHLDDKVLTDWNGMMISSLAFGGAVLGEPQYVDAAARAADFLLKTMRTDGELLHRYRAGDAGISGFLDDYAFLALGLLDLYEATFDARWLDAAVSLLREMDTRFIDTEGGGFFLTASGVEGLVARSKELYDGATPSGNSAAILGLVRAGRTTGDEELQAAGRRALDAWSGTIANSPRYYPYSLTALDLLVGPSREVVIAGPPDAPQTRALVAEVRKRYLPRTLIVLHPPGEAGDAIRKLVPFIANQGMVDGKPTAYVCENYACKAPVTSAAELARLLDE